MLHFRQIMHNPLGDSIQSFELEGGLPGVQVHLARASSDAWASSTERLVAHLRGKSKLFLIPQSLQSLPHDVAPIDFITSKAAPWLVGNYESRELAQEASRLGMSKPLRLRTPSPQAIALFDEAKGKRILGIHFRRGDFREWLNGAWVLPDDWYVSRARRLGPDFDSIWIFSDEPQEASIVFGGLPRCRVISGQGLVPTEEMVLLSQCQGVVCSKSSFSWWSAFWAREGTTVISPHGENWRLTSWVP